MRYASVCDGIGAAHAAWASLGWKCAWHAENDPFPAAVTEQRCDAGPNLGDITKITDEDLSQHAPIQLLVGGTPCQSFSVAGLRAGLDDPRGNLALVFLELAQRSRARWVVWENVPGILSSGSGRDFGAFLGALEQLGYGWSYRTLDAQYVRVDSHARAVPQRRRRVFVVGHLGSWQRAAAVLLEREGLRGDPAPRREAGEAVAALTANGVGTCGADDNQSQAGHLIPGQALVFDRCQVTSHLNYSNPQPGDPCHPSAAGSAGSVGRACIAFHATQDPISSYEHSPALGGNAYCAASIRGATPSGDADTRGQMIVRRLTPLECERLQGFLDRWTAIKWRGKPAPDGRRYRALGNSMAVNVMRWIGQRIEMVESIS